MKKHNTETSHIMNPQMQQAVNIDKKQLRKSRRRRRIARTTIRLNSGSTRQSEATIMESISSLITSPSTFNHHTCSHRQSISCETRCATYANLSVGLQRINRQQRVVIIVRLQGQRACTAGVDGLQQGEPLTSRRNSGNGLQTGLQLLQRPCRTNSSFRRSLLRTDENTNISG